MRYIQMLSGVLALLLILTATACADSGGYSRVGAQTGS